MQTAVWTALAALTALILGLINLWFGVLRPWWLRREASPSSQLDLLAYRGGPTGDWREEIRLVVTNNGPALMESIQVQAFDAAGMSLAADPSVVALWPPMPIDRLHAGQSLYLTLSPSLSTPDAARALVEWSDKRGARQSRMIALSYHRIF